MPHTAPETTDCPHGVPGMRFRWEWPDGSTEEHSEPVILSTPKACHECRCTDPFCARCAEQGA